MNVQSILAAKGSAVATIASQATLEGATASLRDHGVGALIVSDDGASIDGILSERDVVRALAAQGATCLTQSVSSVMSSDVITCQPSDSIDTLMEMMTERRIRHLPVVDDDSKLAGIISIGDVVKLRLDQLEQERDQLENYIQGRA